MSGCDMESTRHPGFVEAVNVERVTLSDDPDTAVAETIALMGRYAREDSADPAILRIARLCRGSNDQETISAVWHWIRQRVRFVQDRTIAAPVAAGADVAEVLIRPVDIIRMRDAQGDCDDFSMLGAALFLACGIPVMFCTVAADPDYPDQFSHVYLYAGGRPFDASHGPYLGWEAPNQFGKRRLWSMSMPMMVNANGLGMAPADGSGGGYWQDLLSQITGAGLQVATSRYGVPPEGTTIQTRDGYISRNAFPQAAFGLQLQQAGFQQQGIPGWMLLALVAVVVVMGSKK